MSWKKFKKRVKDDPRFTHRILVVSGGFVCLIIWRIISMDMEGVAFAGSLLAMFAAIAVVFYISSKIVVVAYRIREPSLTERKEAAGFRRKEHSKHQFEE